MNTLSSIALGGGTSACIFMVFVVILFLWASLVAQTVNKLPVFLQYKYFIMIHSAKTGKVFKYI